MINYCQMTTFSDWLTSRMAEKRMTPAELSRLIKKDQSVISRILNSERSPANETLELIAHALKLPPETVFRAAGILPPASDDPWADEMAFKLAELDPAKRAMAERLIQALAEQEEAEKTKTLKAKRSTG